jgi:very-short-patch-repair endonuclease
VVGLSRLVDSYRRIVQAEQRNNGIYVNPRVSPEEDALSAALTRAHLRHKRQFHVAVDPSYQRFTETPYYVLDFLLPVRLDVEIDSLRHRETKENMEFDRRRDLCLQYQRFTVLRFLNEDVWHDVRNVVWKIRHVSEGLLARQAEERANRKDSESIVEGEKLDTYPKLTPLTPQAITAKERV